MSLAVINAIWIGDRLGEVHAACLRSFLRNGHKVLLHAYENIIDLPDGVELRDANGLLPASRMIRYPNGSPAVFSDLLRYEVLAQGLGLYVDCDMYCVKPIHDAEYIFGYESDSYINNAVLKLPQGSSVLTDLLALKDKKGFVPPWASKQRKIKYKVLASIGLPAKLENLSWGTTGPKALTYYAHENGVSKYAEPIDVFYCLSGEYLSLLVDKGLTLEAIVTPRTKLIHLWNGGGLNSLIKDTGVPEGSPLHEILQV